MMKRSRGPKGCASERIALFLDLENLVHGYRAAGDWGNAVAAVAELVAGLRRRGTLVAAVACCDRTLARRLAIPLAGLGVRVHVHADCEPDAADLELIARLGCDLPESVTTVVIGSGDHIFAGVAARLRARGIRVEMAAVRGTDALALREVVDLCSYVPELAYA